MLIQIVFIRPGNNRCCQRQLGFRTATDAHNFHTIYRLSAQTAYILNADIRLTEAAARNGEVVGWCVIFAEAAVHYDLATRRTRVVAVYYEIVANTVIGRAE